ncbi:hypothetical protein [Synechocystis sp. LKSZ1]|uniref:hypothetical protein n=1 Tax=Synechocystis sp. LKSZ1 TaxID=3144951 RepID=UPI00336BD592
MTTKHGFLLVLVSLSILEPVNLASALEVQVGTIRIQTPGPTPPRRRPVPSKYRAHPQFSAPAASRQTLEMYCVSSNGQAVQSLRQTTSSNSQASSRRVWVYQDCQ